MKLVELKVVDFVNEVDSKSPAPGGGSVAALSSALGVSLAKMVGHLTVGKKKFKALDVDKQDDFMEAETRLNSVKQEFINLIDEDTAAFNLIMAAFKLPKETQEEKALRSQKIEEGTLEAIKVPFKVVKLSLKALKQLEVILKYGNKNCLSDLAVSALMLQSGLEGAVLNVKINLPGISDQELKDHYTKECKEALETSRLLKDELVNTVHNKL